MNYTDNNFARGAAGGAFGAQSHQNLADQLSFNNLSSHPQEQHARAANNSRSPEKWTDRRRAGNGEQ